jgi:3-oxoacyl-[acyl-carrier protein] reductase
MSTSDGQLQGRTAIVTGSASGIGQATAHRFAAEGANVIVADLDEEGARREAAAIEDDSGVARAVPTDVTDGEAVEAMVEATVDDFGSVDVLVNNAGGTFDDDNVHRIDEATWNRNLELNLKAAFLCSRAVLPRMIAGDGGSLVHLSSVNGLFGIGNAAYTAAKGGLLPFSKLIANQYGRHGIRSNVICPGEIDTAAHPHTGNERVVDEWLDQFPLGRFGWPEEIASVALFLASEEASYVSGTQILADGAFTAGPDQTLEVMSHRIDEV